MLSVVVTSCHDEKGCYLTVMAVKAQLEANGLPHELIVVADGGTETKWESHGVKCFRINSGSPQGARDFGIRAAKFKDVLLLEGHVIVSDIGRLLVSHQQLDSVITFPIRVAEGPEMFDVYAHETDWDGNLWYKRVVYKKPSATTYRVAQFGHSCFMLDRDWYLRSGGYTNLLKGWGGEEPLLCLKAWMLGYGCWQVRDVWHAHYLTPGAHAEKPYLENNLAIVGYVIAGRNPHNLVIAPEVEAERRRICAGHFGGDLGKLREYMNNNGVIN